LALGVWIIGFLAVLGWWSSLRPNNDLDWQSDVAKLAWFEIDGDRLTVHNVRDFDWRSETDFTPRYEDRVYDLSKLRGADLFLSYWGSPVIAHTIVSWDFRRLAPLAISIETRKQKGQDYFGNEGVLPAIQHRLCCGRRARHRSRAARAIVARRSISIGST
jgi:hypothetical protein